MNRIEGLLKERNISINQFSKDVGMDYSGAHELVKRKDLTVIKVATLLKVAEYFNISMEDLLK